MLFRSLSKLVECVSAVRCDSGGMCELDEISIVTEVSNTGHDDIQESYERDNDNMELNLVHLNIRYTNTTKPNLPS